MLFTQAVGRAKKRFKQGKISPPASFHTHLSHIILPFAEQYPPMNNYIMKFKKFFTTCIGF
jgi:hypothetical protein